MKTKHLSQGIKTIGLSLIVLLGGLSLANAASGKNTAAHIKANIDKYEGNKATLDVVFIRDIQEKSGVEDVDLFGAITIDDKEHAGGGGMLVIADADDHTKLVRKYGTNAERDGKGKRNVETKSMRGTIRVFEPEKGRPVIYMDLTDDGFEPTAENLGALKVGYKALGGKRGKWKR